MGLLRKDENGRWLLELPNLAGAVVSIFAAILGPAWELMSSGTDEVVSFAGRTWLVAISIICGLCTLWMVAGFFIFTARFAGCDGLTLLTAIASSPLYHEPALFDKLPLSASIQAASERTAQLESTVIDLRLILEQQTGVALRPSGIPFDIVDLSGRVSALEVEASAALSRFDDVRVLLDGLTTDIASVRAHLGSHQDATRADLGDVSKNIITLRDEAHAALYRMTHDLADVHATLARYDGLTHTVEEKTDFALFTTGAVTIPSLTSPDRNLPPNNTLADRAKSLVWWPSRSGAGDPIHSKPWPTGSDMAIHYDVEPGYCWPFNGTRGHLAVQLPVPVLFEEVAIHHTRQHWDISPAPRHIQLWALITGPEALEKASDWATVGDQTPPPELPAVFDQSRYLRIAEFEYDLSSSLATQVFSVDPTFKALEIPLDVVILYILDNWGNEEYTCIYRFQAHGRLASGERTHSE
ncbi:unnamed protein product [Peniophora sp. CBMAI 1063]|nr:unnamed protein product [Peniophora sp. CBMAI 1063]